MLTENALMLVVRVTHLVGTTPGYTASHAKTGLVARGKTPAKAVRNLLRQLSRHARGRELGTALAASLLTEDDVRKYLPEAVATDPLPHGGSTLRTVPWVGETGVAP